jgi:nucleotide-binding universal stress UspA family protein
MKVLIPLDGSDCSKATLEWATNTLDKNTQYYLVSVVADPTHMIVEYEIQDANRYLTEGHEILKNAGCKVEKTEYVIGDAVEMICRYADEENVDQVLMGSHGRTGIAKVFLGSVSSAVLEHCNKPVFLYRNIERKPEKKQKLEKAMFS